MTVVGDSTVTDLDARFSAAREIRRRFEGQWLLNLAYFLGYQWVQYDGNRLWEPPLDPWQVKIVDNRIQPSVLTDIARMTKTRPSYVGVPATTDDEAIAATRLTELVLENEWEDLDQMRKVRGALQWSRICSAGFLKYCWDPTKGKPFTVVTDVDGQIQRMQDGSPVDPGLLDHMSPEMREGLQVQKLAMGDISCEIRSPFQMLVDPLATEDGLNSAEWCGEESIFSQDYVKQRFDIELPTDSESTAAVGDGQLPINVGGIGVQGGAQYRGIRVREYWCLPNGEHPKGRHVIWANHQILQEGDMPYPWLPYVMFRGTPVPGRFWPDAIVTQLISPQTELNKRKAQIAENALRTGNPPLLVPEGNQFTYSGLPGGEIRYQVTGAPSDIPSYLQPPEMGVYIREDITRIEASLQEIAGIHDVSKGIVPTGVTAASAINLLQEADDTRLGPFIADMEQSLADAGRRVAWLAQHYYSDERLVRIGGEDGSWDIQSFRGKEMEANADVRVQAGSAMPRSKAAKQAAIQEFLNLAIQYGMQFKPRDLRRVLQEYEVGGLERFFADVGNDERQINRENQRMANGEELPVNSFDNDEAHVDGHREWMKTASYDRLPPEFKQHVESHLLAHNERIVSKMFPALPNPQDAPDAQSNGGGPPSAVPSPQPSPSG